MPEQFEKSDVQQTAEQGTGSIDCVIIKRRVKECVKDSVHGLDVRSEKVDGETVVTVCGSTDNDLVKQVARAETISCVKGMIKVNDAVKLTPPTFVPISPLRQKQPSRCAQRDVQS